MCIGLFIPCYCYMDAFEPEVGVASSMTLRKISPKMVFACAELC
jgi:hypothetical protein